MHERRCANGRIHPGHQPDRPRRARACPHRAELGQAAGPVALRELRALPRDLLPAGRGAVADAVRSPRARQGPDRAVSELRAPVRRGVEPQPRRRSAGAGAPAPGAQGGGGGGPRPRGGGDQPARGRRRRRQPPGGAPGPLGRRGGQAGPAARLPDAARPGRRLRAAARARRRPLGRVDLPDQHARRRARGAAGPPRSRPRRGAAAPVRPRPGATDRRFDPMMTMDARQRPARVGELRPSQLLSSFGVGATVDLPHLSVMVMGLDDWSPAYTTAVTEERLLAAVRHSLGSQVSALRTAPWLPENDNPFDEWARVGVPVSVFPRWLRCPRCSILAPVSSGLFELKVHPVRTDRTRYEHANCSGARRAPPVLAARFLLACPAGHLDDFPWVEFTHRFAPCADPRLALRETGVSGQASDVQVRCRACGEDAQAKLPRCRGRHPHLATFTPGCDQPVGSILLGASNEWFGVRLRVLSIPARGERLAQLAADHWADLQHVTSPEVLRFARTQPQFGAFAEFGDDDLWAAVEARRSSGGEAPEDPEDLLGPEWAVFSEPDSAPSGGDFQLRAQPPPARFAGRVAQVVLAERLREVEALAGRGCASCWCIRWPTRSSASSRSSAATAPPASASGSTPSAPPGVVWPACCCTPPRRTPRARWGDWWSSWCRRWSAPSCAARTRCAPSTSRTPARCTAPPATRACSRPRPPARPATASSTVTCWSRRSSRPGSPSSAEAAVPHEPLAAAVAETVRTLPPAQVRRLADALANCDGPAQAAGAGIPQLVPTPGFERAARRLLAAWSGGGGGWRRWWPRSPRRPRAVWTCAWCWRLTRPAGARCGWTLPRPSPPWRRVSASGSGPPRAGPPCPAARGHQRQPHWPRHAREHGARPSRPRRPGAPPPGRPLRPPDGPRRPGAPAVGNARCPPLHLTACPEAP